MTKKRFDRIGLILTSLKRAEAAKLKAKLAEIASARNEAKALRHGSATATSATSIAEMRCQSAHQRLAEAKARDLEQYATEAEHEAQMMRGQLSVTLGRERAAESLAKAEARIAQALAERRTEW